MFKARYPRVAQAEIPYVNTGPFDLVAPAQAFYFYRRRAAKILEDDAELLTLRRRLIVLTWLAVGFLPVSFVALIFVTRLVR
jgi:hypothetical protein